MEELVLKYGFTYGPLMLLFLGLMWTIYKWGPVIAGTMATLLREMTAALNASTAAINNSSAAIERNTEIMLKHGDVATMVSSIYTILTESEAHKSIHASANAAIRRLGRDSAKPKGKVVNYSTGKGKTMVKKFVAVFAFMLVATSSFAGDMGVFTYKQDRSGRTNFVLEATLYANEALAGPTAVSATCPAPAEYIKFDPGVSADFRIKANGSGAPTGAAVTNGTGWRNNVAELMPINTVVSGTLVNSYAVYSTVSNIVPYTCYAK